MEEVYQIVRTNLVHYQLWNAVQFEIETVPWTDKETGESVQLRLISGCQPESDVRQYVLPVEFSQYQETFLTPRCLNWVFEKLVPVGIEKLILAIVGDDGTTVFYNLKRGF